MIRVIFYTPALTAVYFIYWLLPSSLVGLIAPIGALFGCWAELRTRDYYFRKAME